MRGANTMTTRKKWDTLADAEFRSLSRPAVAALSRVAGDLEPWRYAAIHALLAELAEEAAYSKTQLLLGPQPPLISTK